MDDDPVNEEAIFKVASQITQPEARAAYLRQICGDRSAVFKRVASLLQAFDQDPQFLESPLLNVSTTPTAPQIAESAGAQIGRYKLLQQIGEGGFGVVFMAEQTEPLRRKVALKIIKPGMDTRQVIARFEAERQALAVMDHPNIARVLDAGATHSGRPYFVMELVRGLPITQYCDDANLTVRERLELFTRICQAIQHAHTKGIIHRDIKPTNVLVSRQDGQPFVKVIDFGVAKAMGKPLTDKTMFTDFAQMIGTPLYMSPEQAELSSTDIDTRSDVYSLGVLLYELLTGSTPVDKEQLKSAAFDEIRRMIREDDPQIPSTRISAGVSAPSIAAHRHTEPAKLARIVRGELDWIVMKALDKDRNRRYESASGLATDVRRFLQDESVQACPPSIAYRLRKFARRNRTWLIPALLVSAAILCGAAVAVWQAISATRAMSVAVAERKRADQEAASAKRVIESMQQMLGLIDPDAASRSIMSLSAVRLQVLLGLFRPDADQGLDYTLTQLIDDFAEALDDKLAGEPAAAADLHATVGRAYACRGERDKAQVHLARGLALGRAVYGDQHDKYADLLVDFARPDGSDRSEWSNREDALRQALAIYRARGVEGERVIRCLWTLQWNLMEQSAAGAIEKGDRIEAVLDEALAEAAKTPGIEYPKIASIHSGLAKIRMRQARYAEAERIAQQAVAMHLRSHPNSLETAWGQFVYASTLRVQGKFAEAIAADLTALALMRETLPPSHPNNAVAANALIQTLSLADESHKLAALFSGTRELRDLEAIFREMVQDSEPTTFDYADPAFVAAQGLARVLQCQWSLSRERTAAGLSTEAAQAREMAQALFQSLQHDFTEQPDLCPYLGCYGAIALLESDQPEMAKVLIDKLRQTPMPESVGALNSLAWFLATADNAANRDPQLAAELAETAVALNPRIGNYWNSLGVARFRKGDFGNAIIALEKSTSIGQGGNSFDYFFLAMANWRLGNKVEAHRWYDEAVDWMDKHLPNNKQLLNWRAEAAALLELKKNAN